MPPLVDHVTALSGKGAIFLNLNTRKRSLKKVKAPAQSYSTGKHGC